jgi:hypothetical protein
MSAKASSYSRSLAVLGGALVVLFVTGCSSGSVGSSTPPTVPASTSAGVAAAASSSTAVTPTPAASSSAPASAGLGDHWTGTWKDVSADHLSGSFALSWSQTGNTLKGTITITGTGCLNGGTVTGAVAGSQISFGAVSGQVKVAYKGTINGSGMSGTYSTACGNASGNWTASKG